jgi:hypothetical protein
MSKGTLGTMVALALLNAGVFALNAQPVSAWANKWCVRPGGGATSCVCATGLIDECSGQPEGWCDDTFEWCHLN